MSASVSIIPAQTEHLAIVVDLLRAQLEEHEIDTATADLQAVAAAVIAEPRHGFILLAMANETAIGLAYAAAHLSAEHGGTVGWIEELYVTPVWRSRGAGSSLLEGVIARAAQHAWRALELEVVAGHERAVPLYQRHGFAALSRTRFTRLP